MKVAYLLVTSVDDLGEQVVEWRKMCNHSANSAAEATVYTASGLP